MVFCMALVHGSVTLNKLQEFNVKYIQLLSTRLDHHLAKLHGGHGHDQTSRSLFCVEVTACGL